jgi:phospholipid N-methyltransferase
VTDTLVGLLQPGDTLDLVEINAAFVAILQARLEQLPRWRRVRRQVRVLHLPVQDVPGTQVYDFLISGLPLNNFPLTLVEDIFASYQRLGRPGGTLSYFEYVGIRVLKMVIVSAAERQRLAALDNFLTQRLQWQQFAAETVWWNAPPAVARHLRL